MWSNSLVKKTPLSFSLLSFPMDCVGSDVLQLCTESSGYAEFFLKDNKKVMELKCFSFEEKWHCEAKVGAGTEAALKTYQSTTQAKLRRIFYFQGITFYNIQESGILVHSRVKIGYDPLIFFFIIWEFLTHVICLAQICASFSSISFSTFQPTSMIFILYLLLLLGAATRCCCL